MNEQSNLQFQVCDEANADDLPLGGGAAAQCFRSVY
jgi:hypothetical protein